MKQLTTLISTLFFLVVGVSHASALPNCVGSWSVATWDNCVGTYTFSSGNKYVGEYKNGKIHGQGTYTYASGNKYVGEYKDGKMHGQGTVIFANGDKYVGENKDGKRNGQGTFTHANGDKYVGEWQDDKMHGQGTYTFANGEKWVGDWKNDNLNGYAITYYADGSIKQEGIFKDDKFLYAQKPKAEAPKVENKSVNRDALTLKGISVDMSIDQSKKILIEGGYSCKYMESQLESYYACNKGDAEIKIGNFIIGNNFVGNLKEGINFSCENFNLCGYKLEEAASLLNDHFKFPKGMKYDRDSLMGDPGVIPRYCGRGKAGDIMCVSEFKDLYFPLSILLIKGSISSGGVSFD